MDTAEPRAKWAGGDGPSLESVNGQSRRQMNDHALQAFRGLWDVTRCPSPNAASAASAALAAGSFSLGGGDSGSNGIAEPVSCVGPVALWHRGLRRSGDSPRGLSLEATVQEEPEVKSQK
jgi:hypothetical protein